MASIAFLVVGTVLLLAWALWRFVLFDRDPERTPPAGASQGVLAPADGTILYVRRVESEEAPIAIKQGRAIPFSRFVGRTGVRGPGYLVGIFMHPTSVHVNRAPISGTVRAVEYVPGSNLPMNVTWMRVHLRLRPYERHASHLLTNERNFVLVSNARMWVCLVQIADYFVNRIDCWVKAGDQVQQGQRLGRIRFGSQVDAFFPDVEGLQLKVSPGQSVRAGLDLLALIAGGDEGRA